MLQPAGSASRASPHALTALGTRAVIGAAAAAFLCAVPAAAQEGNATGMGTTEEPEGQSPDGQSLEQDPPTDGNPVEGPVEIESEPGEPPSLATPVPAPPPLTGDDGLNAAGDREIAFEADTLSYDSGSEIVTATGNVVLRNADQSVRADAVRWNRSTGVIMAEGRVRFVDEEGNQLFSDSLELTDEFEAGAMENLLLALRQGGRLAANQGIRTADGTITLTEAAYTGCNVVTSEGCPREPSWKITAERVIYDPAEKRIRFNGAFLEIFGLRILPLPGLAIRTDGGAVSGFLVPDLRVSESNGVEISGSYYMRLGTNKDLTASAYLYTEARPMVSAQWRHLTGKGAYQITGYATYGEGSSSSGSTIGMEDAFRGYLFANGRFQFNPEWSLTASIRRTTDRTFLRRYDISRDDRLRSTVELERIDDDSYLSLAGWATQTLRLNTDQGQVPLALPVLDFRQRMTDPWLGGTAEFQVNTLAIQRSAGQDTQRAFASARWDLRRITGMGQVVTVTGLARGDVYHSDENFLTDTAIYRGNPGWQARGVGLAAVDVQWPLVGEFFGGEQVLTPRVQIVAAPSIKNLAIPNEDSRALDLEDTNLFSLNRFPGYDRVEDGARITYGFDWQLRRPGWEIKSSFGQSYRLDKNSAILVDGTGLSERVSDFVGRTEVRFRDFVKFTHRFRLDKDNLAPRRNEIDATVGTSRTYAEVGYLRLNRDITAVEDLQDREELRVAGRYAFADFWSVFGSGVFNLTNRDEDPSFKSDGFDPLRTRLGIAYEDDCLEMGLTWRRDYVTSGDAQRGDTFQVYVSLRNLGFR